jgi:hypothetical protein
MPIIKITTESSIKENPDLEKFFIFNNA